MKQHESLCRANEILKQYVFEIRKFAISISEMGPNSGGGKRNKTKSTPARARFSSFRPEHKTKGSGKESEGREQKKRAVKSGISASVAGALDQVSQSLLAAADVFQLPAHVADHVISLFSRSAEHDNSECSSSTSSSDDDCMATMSADPVDTIEKATEELRLDFSLDHVLSKSPRKGLSDSEIGALQLFGAMYGFTKEDFVNLSDIVGSDHIDLCAGAVMRLCGIDVASFKQHSPSSVLEEELVTVASIYGQNFSVQRSFSGCVLSQLTYEVSGSSAILAIQCSDLYPSNDCRVAAWFHGPSLSRSNCVLHCRDALKRVMDRCALGSPIIFDLFQMLEEVSLPHHFAETESHSQLQQIYDKYKFTPSLKHPTETTFQMLAQNSVVAVEEPKVEMMRPSVATATSGTEFDCTTSIPSDFVQNIRIQYNKALNWADESGFFPPEASQKAKQRLCGMFPQFSEASILASLSGKSFDLDKPSIAFKVQELDFGVQLQCTKAIMKSIDVTKGKAKSLLALAQQHIIEDGGSIFASSIDEAKQLWVDLSVSLHEEQNLARRKQQAANYQIRRGIAATTFSVAAAAFPSSAEVVSNSEGRAAKLDSAKAASQQKEDLNVAHVSKLFSEQQCADAVMAHSNRMRQKTLPPEKNDSEIKKDAQLSQRMCEELQAKIRSDRYQRMLSSREQLPAFQQQDKIISDIRNNRVILVVGDTGYDLSRSKINP